jgi:hypothetical protein
MVVVTFKGWKSSGKMVGIMGVGAGDEKVKDSLALPMELGWKMWWPRLGFSSNSSERELSSS